MSGRTICRSPRSREIAGPIAWWGNRLTASSRRSARFTKARITLASARIFATPTKPDYAPIGLEEIRKVHEAVRIPIFCIGGIKLDNLPEVIAAGARRVVIVSGLLQAKDIAQYGRAAKELLNRKSKS